MMIKTPLLRWKALDLDSSLVHDILSKCPHSSLWGGKKETENFLGCVWLSEHNGTHFTFKLMMSDEQTRHTSFSLHFHLFTIASFSLQSQSLFIIFLLFIYFHRFDNKLFPFNSKFVNKHRDIHFSFVMGEKRVFFIIIAFLVPLYLRLRFHKRLHFILPEYIFHFTFPIIGKSSALLSVCGDIYIQLRRNIVFDWKQFSSIGEIIMFFNLKFFIEKAFHLCIFNLDPCPRILHRKSRECSM